MKRTVYADDFVRAFDEMGRSDNFSKAGRYALYDYLMEYEREVNTEIDLDVIVLCCEYSEYPCAYDCAFEHGIDLLGEEYTEEEKEAEALKFLEERTTVIPFEGGVIIQAF